MQHFSLPEGEREVKQHCLGIETHTGHRAVHAITVSSCQCSFGFTSHNSSHTEKYTEKEKYTRENAAHSCCAQSTLCGS